MDLNIWTILSLGLYSTWHSGIPLLLSALLSIPVQVSLGQWRCGPHMLGSGGWSAKWESTNKLE